MLERPHYRLVLPPGWAQIPLDDRADQAIALIADRAAANHATHNSPSNAAEVKDFVASKLSGAVAAGRRAAGVDLYLPIELVHGAPVPLSIVVSAPQLPNPLESKATALLAFSARGASQAVEVGGLLGVRQASDSEALFDASGELIAPASRRVNYVIAPPHGDNLLVITGNMMRIDGPDAERVQTVLEKLFDAMVQSLRLSTEREKAL